MEVYESADLWHKIPAKLPHEFADRTFAQLLRQLYHH